MTDTDNDLFDAEVTDEVDDEDEDFDFEHLFPEPGPYELKVLSVAYRDYDNEKTGRHVIGLNIRLQIKEPGNEFDGTFITHFMYLGEDKPSPNGRTAMKAFMEACGVEVEGKMKLSQLKPVWRQIGKTRDRCLSVFDDLPVGANLDTEERTIGGDTRETSVVKSFMSLDTLAEVKAAVDSSTEGF